jgi:coenzyme F420-0:L-glutamate ligase / coenzyme F420-1:gamma-L-glutamate ligase
MGISIESAPNRAKPVAARQISEKGKAARRAQPEMVMHTANGRVSLTGLDGIPLIAPGDDLAGIIASALDSMSIALEDGDILVVAQKIVSKAENRYRNLSSVIPSEAAKEFAQMLDKDARHIEVILEESSEVLRRAENALITVHRLGFVMANAGVDQSNIEQGDEPGMVLLLPKDPDGAAAALKATLDERYGVACGVIINDSFGRPWRKGVVGVALGAAGIPSLRDLVGTPDLFGRALRITEHAAADEIASAASLIMGQAAEGTPVVHIRGLYLSGEPSPAEALIRPKYQDVFR